MTNNSNQNDFGVGSLIEMSMTPADIEAVINIERHTFNPPWSESMFREELSNSHSRCLVFKTDKDIVSFMCFWIILDEAHLLNIAVHPVYRRLGVGSHMVERLEKICRNDGAKRIILDVARKNNAARVLYKKSGFNSIGFRKRYYPAIDDDAIVMEKWIL